MGGMKYPSFYNSVQVYTGLSGNNDADDDDGDDDDDDDGSGSGCSGWNDETCKM
jgi:hypothetical protein